MKNYLRKGGNNDVSLTKTELNDLLLKYQQDEILEDLLSDKKMLIIAKEKKVAVNSALIDTLPYHDIVNALVETWKYGMTREGKNNEIKEYSSFFTVKMTEFFDKHLRKRIPELEEEQIAAAKRMQELKKIQGEQLVLAFDQSKPGKTG